VKKNLKQREKLTFHPSLFKLRSVTRHVARVSKRNTQQFFFVRNPEENGSLGISRRQREDNIKIHPIKLEREVTKPDLVVLYLFAFNTFFLKLVTDVWLSQKRDTS